MGVKLLITSSALITTVNVIFVFFVVVIFHEFGHYFVAKLAGIKVHEFAIGMGPKIFKYNYGETDYSIRLLPIGGYVKMEGEDESSEDERSFGNKPILSRMAVIAAGAIMNFILAFLLFVIVFYNIGKPVPIINEVTEEQPAYHAGLRSGDKIVKINNEVINSWDDVKNNISLSNANEIKITVERDSKNEEYYVTPIVENGRTIIGIVPEIKKSISYSIKVSFENITQWFSKMFEFFGRLFRGNINKEEVGGPIKIVSLIGEASQFGFLSVLMIAAIISLNLGFFNLLPIPALDGSRLMFLFLELLRGKPIDPEKEGFVHFIGFVFLIILMIVVGFKDISSLF